MPDHIIVCLGMRLALIGDGLKDARLQITDEQLPTVLEIIGLPHV